MLVSKSKSINIVKNISNGIQLKDIAISFSFYILADGLT